MSVFDTLHDSAWDDFSCEFARERTVALELVWSAPPAHAAEDTRWADILTCGLETSDSSVVVRSASADARASIFCGVAVATGASRHARAFIPLPPPLPILPLSLREDADGGDAAAAAAFFAPSWATLPDTAPLVFERIIAVLGFRGLDFATANRARSIARDATNQNRKSRPLTSVSGVSTVCRAWAKGWVAAIGKAHSALIAPRWRALEAALCDRKRAILGHDTAATITTLRVLGLTARGCEIVSARVARRLLEDDGDDVSLCGSAKGSALTREALIAAAAAAANARSCGEAPPLDPGIGMVGRGGCDAAPDETLIAWLCKAPPLLRNDTYATAALLQRGAAAAAAGAAASRAWVYLCVALPALRAMGSLGALRRVEMPAAAAVAEAQRWGIGYNPHTVEKCEADARSRVSVFALLGGGGATAPGAAAAATEMYAAAGLAAAAVGGGVREKDCAGAGAGGGGGLSRITRGSAAALLGCPRLHATPRHAVTGRISLAAPPLQSLSGTLRSAIIAAPGKMLISGDFSNLEVRILAHFCGDTALRWALRVGARDVFEEMSERWQEEVSKSKPPDPNPAACKFTLNRSAAKTLVYVSLYGGGDSALASALGAPASVARAAAASFAVAFPGVAVWTRATQAKAGATAKIYTIAGRVRSFSCAAEARRLAVSARCQGSAADVFKVALARVAARAERENSDFPLPLPSPSPSLLPPRHHTRHAATGLLCASAPPATRIVLHIHDEIVLETTIECAAQTARWLREEMSLAGVDLGLAVTLPVKTEAGVAWGSMQSLS